MKVEGSDGVEITGQVKIKVGGDTITMTLKDGKLKLNLGKFDQGQAQGEGDLPRQHHRRGQHGHGEVHGLLDLNQAQGPGVARAAPGPRCV